MLNFKKYSFIVLLTIIYSQEFEPGLRDFIPINSPISNTGINPPALPFSMNHGFSLIANSNQLGSSTIGVYSNQVEYKFSNKLSLNSTFHLMNSNQSFYSNDENFNINYELGLEYKLSENSRIFFQFSNIGQQTKIMPNIFRPGL